MSKSIRRDLLTAGLALGSALVVLAVVLLSGSGNAVHAATGVHDGSAGSINQVAIDMDITGNGTGDGTTLLGPVNTVIDNVPVGDTHVIDVIVDEVNAADGNVYSYGGNIYYNGVGASTSSGAGIISIDGDGTDPPTFAHITGSGTSPVCSDDPDTSGNWCFGAFNTSTSHGHSGEGILLEVGIKCETQGYSDLILADDNNGGVPEVYAVTFGSTAMPVTNIGSARIYCGESAGTPTPTPSPTPTGAITQSPTPTGGITESPTPTGGITESPTPTGGITESPTPTGGITESPTPTGGITGSPTPTPTHTPTPTPTHTPTPTPTPTPSAAGATTAHATGSGIPTPKVLPQTGGPSSDGSSTAMLLLLLAFGGALILAAGGSVVYAGASRKR